jgi:hypothetical protein
MIRPKCVALAATLASLVALLPLGCSSSHGSHNSTSSDAGTGHDTGSSITSKRTYAPTITAIYNEILTKQCAIPFCHGGAAGSTPQFSSPDDSYQELVNKPASGAKCADAGAGGLLLVVPGQPDMSLLYMKLEQPSPPGLCGDPMPGNGPPLGPMDLQQIKEWIEMGAENN